MKKFHLNNINLKNQLLIVYFLSVFIPILLTNIIFYHVTISNVKKQKEADLALAVEHMADSFERVVNDAIGISSTLYTDKMLHDFLEKDYDSIVEYVQDYDNVWRNYKYSTLYSSIQNILLYTDNQTVLYAGGVRNLTESATTKEWISEVLEADSYIPRVIRTHEENDPNTYIFSVIRLLNHFHSNTKEKLIKIDLNTELIRKSFENATFQGQVYLVNKHNEILYSTEFNEIEHEGRFFSDEYVLTDSLIFSETYHDHYMEDWRVIGVVSESVALEEAQNSRLLIFLFASINFIVPSFVIIYITSSLHVRLLRILRKMKKVKDQQFDIIEGVEYKDEIGQLTSEFNRMSKKMKDLINDVYLANIQKKDLELKSKQAQLSALQSQINPHFLFNSLETIRMRSLLKGENETANIIKSMAKILRNSISWGKEWVRVEEEVKMLEYFLEIQQYRFGQKLEYEITMDENVKDCIVPNMSFTPFVENASIHGVEPKLGNGIISVTIKMKGEYIVCTVKDNGVGMEDEFLQDYLHSLEEDESMGDRVGIRNVYYRMKLLYGDQFTFTMKSNLGEGTTVEIICPASHELKP